MRGGGPSVGRTDTGEGLTAETNYEGFLQHAINVIFINKSLFVVQPIDTYFYPSPFLSHKSQSI